MPRRALGVLAVLLTSLSCSSHVVVRPVGDIQVLSEKAVFLEVPVEKQPIPNLCGVSAVEMLTRYHDRPLGEAQRSALRSEAERDGAIRVASLEAALKAAGYEVAVFSGTLDHAETGLFLHLDKRRPLVVLTGSKGRTGHYMLVTGYDPERGLVVVLDPVRGFLAYSNQSFDTVWKGTHRATILALPVSKNEGNK